MGPKKQKSEKTRKLLTVELKQEIIRKRESGKGVSDLGREYGLSKSTIGTILAMKESIMAANVAKGSSLVFVKGSRTSIHEEMEQLLMVWINERQMKGDPTSKELICEKARTIFEQLIRDKAGPSSEQEEEFKASRGWFERFKKRTGIHSVLMHGEAGSADKEAAEEFVEEFQELMKKEGYLPEQVFNADETGLFWKRMPNRSYITMEEKKLPGTKQMKDRLTLLLGANATGDLKLKPLLIYRSETPKAFRSRGVSKSSLPVFWRSNRKAWVTQPVFKDWVMNVFAPSVQKFLQNKDLPVRAVLVLDNAPGHPKDLENYIEAKFPWVRVIYLPPNITSLLQPMDQNVIANFKKLYTRDLFRMCFEANQFGTVDTMKEFWKKGFDIYDGVRLIGKAWSEVTQKCLNAAWKKLYPAFVVGETPEEESEKLVQEIVSTAKNLNMDVNEEDVEKLIEEHQDELTTDELQALFQETQQEEKHEFSSESDEEDRKATAPTAAIKEHLKMWEKVKAFVLEWHPQEVEAGRLVDLFNDNAMHHFRQLLKKREKQTTLDRFFAPPPAKKAREEAEVDAAQLSLPPAAASGSPENN